MNGRASAVAATLIMLLWASAAAAQMHYQPTPYPLVTAEREAWYLAGDPVVHSGNVYYPAGPAIHFLPHEMVRSGFFHGIPLLVRTTIEPTSIVYVPIGRGLVQPYERRRDGNIAGTVGSTAPSFPVTRHGEQRPDPDRLFEAPAPPYRAPTYLDYYPTHALGIAPAEPEPGMGVEAAPRAPARPARLPGRNEGIFIDFQGRRWFSVGPAVHMRRAGMKQIGEHHGLPVLQQPRDASVYVPISNEPGAALVRYTRR